MTEELLKSALMELANGYSDTEKQLRVDLALARAQVITLQQQLAEAKGETEPEKEGQPDG